MRITESLKRMASTEQPDTPLATYQCHRRGCGYIYEVAAHAYQASE
jgi:hypothetical protein